MKIPSRSAIARVMQNHLPVHRRPLAEWQARWFVSRLETWAIPFYTAQDARALSDLRDKAEALAHVFDALPENVRERFAGSMLMNRKAEGLSPDVERLGEQIAALVEVAGFLRQEADLQKGRADRNIEGIAVTACAWEAWDSGHPDLPDAPVRPSADAGDRDWRKFWKANDEYWEMDDSSPKPGSRKAPPSSMNEADPFLAFLQDLLSACEIEGDQRSCFNSFLKWREKHL